MTQDINNSITSSGMEENLEKYREKLQVLLGQDAVFEMDGKLPAFRVPSKSVHNTCKKLKDEGFDYLLFVTAVDYPQQNKIEIVYMHGCYSDSRQIAIVADLDRVKPEIETVSDICVGANWHEREVFDLFGINFINHPHLQRILLDDSYEGYPLRKDYVDKVHNVIKRPY